MVFSVGFLQASKRNFSFRSSFLSFATSIAQFLSHRTWKQSPSLWSMCSVNCRVSWWLQICLLSLCVADSLQPTAKIGSPTCTASKSTIWRKRGRAVQLHLVHSPTDHFTYQRQVNPFIVIKWGSVMYSGCERLNPVLSFLWGRQILADIRSVQRPPEAQNYQSNSDAEIEQHTLKEICVCVFVYVCSSWCTSVPGSAFEYCISATLLRSTGKVPFPFELGVRLKCHNHEELQIWVDVSPWFKNRPRIDLRAVTVPLMAPVFCGSWSVSQQQCFLSLLD